MSETASVLCLHFPENVYRADTCIFARIAGKSTAIFADG